VQVEPVAQTVGPVQPFPPHCPYLVCVGPIEVLVVVEMIVVLEVLEVLELELELELDLELVVDVLLELLEPTEPAAHWPGNGPAMDVVIGPFSMKIPDQYQSSGAAFVPPLGRRSSPMCQSSEFVDGLPEIPDTTLVSGAEPVDCQSPIAPLPKSMSYAKLYHVPATRGVLHFVTPPTSQRRVLSVTPASPEMRPYLISVK